MRCRLPGPQLPAQTASSPVRWASPPAANAATSSCRTRIHSILPWRRSERSEFGRIPACDLVIAAGPAVLDLDVLPDGPAQLLQPLKKCRIARLCDGIVRDERYEHADAPPPFALLRARRKRPRGRRAG